MRAPSHAGPAPRAPRGEEERVILRLAVSRGALGLELDRPARLGPLQVTALEVALRDLAFPLDLSGGVPRFRHRRGTLEGLAVEASLRELCAHFAPRLRGLLGDGTPALTLAPLPDGVAIALVLEATALAFDLLWAPLDGDVRLLVERARGVGLGAPSQLLALRAARVLAGPRSRPHGSAVVLDDAAGELGRHLLPAAGARAPSSAGCRWTSFDAGVELLRAAAREGAPPHAHSQRILSALEACELTLEADDALAAGDLAAARAGYLRVLERAPRHPEVSRRIAEIDASEGSRAEAALSMLVEALPAHEAGSVGGALLLAAGDREGARAAWARAAETEPFGALAALLWVRVAEAAEELPARLASLDQAVARAPALVSARWARLEARLDAADVRGARADAEHLEASVSGAHARHEVLARFAGALLDRGMDAEAIPTFERALRYAPDRPEAVAGLARGLLAAGRSERAVDLLARAVHLAERAGRPAHRATLDLARALADVVGDLPAAIARARAVPAGVAEAFEARALEGRCRARLGDVAGASLAYARLRDLVSLAVELGRDGLDVAGLDAPRVLDALHAAANDLCDAAAFEERDRRDLLAAKRHLGLALRLRPRDRALAAEFQRVAREAARPRTGEPGRAADAPPAAPPEPPSAPAPRLSTEPEHDPEVERRIDALTQRLRADPRDAAAASELASLLERAGRDLELLALLSARMDEGDAAQRALHAPAYRGALTRLSARARAEGRVAEADLYERMRASLERGE